MRKGRSKEKQEKEEFSYRIIRFFAALRMTGKSGAGNGLIASVDGRQLKNGSLFVILRSPPEADDEESQRIVKRAAYSMHGG